MEKYYFTFGFGQPMRELLDYVEIIAEDYSKAREEMVKNFNARWSFQYDEEKWKGQAEEFNLTRYITICA